MIRIISDSSSNILQRENSDYRTVPFRFVIDGKDYVDDENLVLEDLVNAFDSTKEKSSSACPNIQDWMDQFNSEDDNICVTISKNLSGAYSSAMQAKDIFEEETGHRVEVLDSHSTGPEMELDIEKIEELIKENLSVGEILEKLTEYKNHTNVFFLTSSVKNLVNNGRVSKFAGAVVGALHISMIGRGTDEGRIEIIRKTRNSKQAMDYIYTKMKELGFNGGKVRISDCFNESGCRYLSDKIKNDFPAADVICRSVTGLCSYYVENKGIIIAFED